VWVFADGVLRVRRVEVARADRGRAYISSGLEDGDQVIVSSLDVITDGMKVRIAGAGENEPPAQTDDGVDTSSATLDVSPADETSDRFSAIRDQRNAAGGVA
jgi:hypothetical protein